MNLYRLNRIQLCLLLSPLLLLHIGCEPKQTVKHSEKEVLAAVNQFNKAFQDGDISTLESMITDSYRHSNGSSKAIDKEQWLNYLRKRKNELENGTLVIVDYSMDETEVTIYENTAIVTARVTVSSIRSEGQIKSQYRVTNVWLNQQGEWKRAGFHDGKIVSD